MRDSVISFAQKYTCNISDLYVFGAQISLQMNLCPNNRFVSFGRPTGMSIRGNLRKINVDCARNRLVLAVSNK